MDVLNLAEPSGEGVQEAVHHLPGPLSGDAWSLTDERSRALWRRFAAPAFPWGEYLGGRFTTGSKTGLNEAFVIDAETRAR
jgi:hypothetical protein